MAGKPKIIITLSDSERRSLQEMTQPTAQHRYAQRAKAILMAAEGNTSDEITEKTGLSKVSISKWKGRFAEKRHDGLKDLPRSGAKPKYDHDDILKIAIRSLTEWIIAHPDVKFHFRPTHASWLNQIELWFSILYRQSLKRGDFKSKEDLEHKIIQFIEDYNRRARPFAWTYKGKPLMIIC